MIKRCIVHFGLPKTGTTSIQKFLRYSLSDGNFCYPAFTTEQGWVDDCHNGALSCAFRSDPYKFHTHAKVGLAKDVIRRQGAAFREQLQREVKSSSAHTLILSAEELTWFPADDIRSLTTFLTSLGLEVQALAFVRRFKRDQESRFQQSVRDPGWRQLSKPRGLGFSPIGSSYKYAISRFDDCLGSSNVLLSEFDPSKLEGGCAVRHFCKVVRIEQQNIPTTFANNSLSSEALNLLYAYRSHGPGYGEGWSAMEANNRLIKTLSELKGTRLLFHSSLLTSMEDKWREDVEWAIERTGFDLLGNIYEDDDKLCYRCADDMFRFSPRSLEWLARMARIKPSKLRNADPRIIAEVVDILARNLTRQAKSKHILWRLTSFFPQLRSGRM
jgi:hypothetical protein